MDLVFYSNLSWNRHSKEGKSVSMIFDAVFTTLLNLARLSCVVLLIHTVGEKVKILLITAR